MLINELVESKDVNQHKEMLGMVLDHKLLSIIKPDHLLSLKDANATFEIVLNVNASLQFVKEAKNKNQLVVKHVTLNIHVSNYTTITRTTHILGLHP
jgi:hypothetical protein